MSPKDITILGCSSQQPTRDRNHGAYLVRWNEEGFLFDPGEGTQRQFIFANVAPTVVNRIFVSHFHGDHCLGLGSMLMRLNLDKVTHPIHCYYPASGKIYFDRLRYGSIYHEQIRVIEHPVHKEGLVDDDGQFCIEAKFLDHGIDNIGWRITEKPKRRYDRDRLKLFGVQGPMVQQIQKEGFIWVNDRKVLIEEVSYLENGDILSVVIDTRECQAALDLAKSATVLICESTYLDEHRELAKNYHHLTAKQAAHIAKESGVKLLILTHFSARYQGSECFENEAKVVFPHVVAAEDGKVIPFPKK
ncbi:MAG: ribonuclease Z [Rhabdochlamydiaceae bacterium]